MLLECNEEEISRLEEVIKGAELRIIGERVRQRRETLRSTEGLIEDIQVKRPPKSAKIKRPDRASLGVPVLKKLALNNFIKEKTILESTEEFFSGLFNDVRQRI